MSRPFESARYRWEPWRTVSIHKGGGPERVAEEAPPEDWTPPPPVGFGLPPVDGKSDQPDDLEAEEGGDE